LHSAKPELGIPFRSSKRINLKRSSISLFIKDLYILSTYRNSGISFAQWRVKGGAIMKYIVGVQRMLVAMLVALIMITFAIGCGGGGSDQGGNTINAVTFEQVIGSQSTGIAFSVKEISTGGFIVTGDAWQNNNTEGYLAILNGNGGI
jgi:hypothetical protein